MVIRAEGATRVELDADGQLVFETPGGRLRQTPPETSEVLANGEARRVESRFRIIDQHHYGFDAPGRDAALPLIVDPGLVWSSFTGGTGGKTLAGIEMARDGGRHLPLGDYLLAKFLERRHLAVDVEAAFVRRARERRRRCAALPDVHLRPRRPDICRRPRRRFRRGVILVGSTADRDLPTTAGAFQRNNANTNLEALDGDGFVTRLDAFGSLVFSTYLGGALNDMRVRRPAGSRGEIIVTGTTRSSNFPTTAGAYDTSFNRLPPATTRRFRRTCSSRA